MRNMGRLCQKREEMSWTFTPHRRGQSQFIKRGLSRNATQPTHSNLLLGEVSGKCDHPATVVGRCRTQRWIWGCRLRSTEARSSSLALKHRAGANPSRANKGLICKWGVSKSEFIQIFLQFVICNILFRERLFFASYFPRGHAMSRTVRGTLT